MAVTPFSVVLVVQLVIVIIGENLYLLKVNVITRVLVLLIQPVHYGVISFVLELMSIEHALMGLFGLNGKAVGLEGEEPRHQHPAIHVT